MLCFRVERLRREHLHRVEQSVHLVASAEEAADLRDVHVEVDLHQRPQLDLLEEHSGGAVQRDQVLAGRHPGVQPVEPALGRLAPHPLDLVSRGGATGVRRLERSDLDAHLRGVVPRAGALLSLIVEDSALGLREELVNELRVEVQELSVHRHLDSRLIGPRPSLGAERAEAEGACLRPRSDSPSRSSHGQPWASRDCTAGRVARVKVVLTEKLKPGRAR